MASMFMSTPSRLLVAALFWLLIRISGSASESDFWPLHEHHSESLIFDVGRTNQQDNCDIPAQYRITCGALTDNQCQLAGCCLGTDPELRCFTDIRSVVTSLENRESKPCSLNPPHCDVLDRTPCDLRGRRCGVGILTELRRCKDPTTGITRAVYTHRLCCNPSKACTDHSPVEVIMCANVFPECEMLPGRNHSRRLRRDTDALEPPENAADQCDRVCCGPFGREECEMAGCLYDPRGRQNKCYTHTRELPVSIWEYPCKKTPDHCEVTERSDCDLQGRSCGLGVLTETMTCTDLDGMESTVVVERMCCMTHCPGSGAPPFVQCSHVYPECERSRRKVIRRPIPEGSLLNQDPKCRRVPCRQYRNPECEYAGCHYDPDADKDKCYRDRHEPSPHVTEYPCKKLPPDCELVSREPCDLRGKKCGIGVMSEVRDCEGPDGQRSEVTVTRLCCVPDKKCTGSAPVPLLICADVYPDCESGKPTWSRRPDSPYYQHPTDTPNG